MQTKDNLKFGFDTLSLIGFIVTIISILLSFNLSISEIITSISIFLIIIATYIYFSFKEIINKHAQEIQKINEKINIHRDIADLKAKVEILFNNKMKKRGQTSITEVLIRIIQIVAILIAGYIILKALGVIS